MSSSEAYLDNLLSALNGEQNIESAVEQDVIEKMQPAEDVEMTEEQETEEQETEEQETEEQETEEQETEEETEEIPVVPISDDPNKTLSADEIAALFAQVNEDVETGDHISIENQIETAEEANVTEELSIDDLLAQMEDEKPDLPEEEAEADILETSEEIEIDMNNPEEIELLLSLGDRPDWSAHTAEAEMETGEGEQEAEEMEETAEEQPEQSAEEILAAMSEENSDLQEINSLLNKLDNNELVGDGIEESVLVDFAESDYETEQDPWLDELLSNIEGKQKGKKKKSKKKFSWFGKKKKEDEMQKENPEPEVAETVSEQDAEKATEILQNLSEDNSEIPVDLFAAAENEAEKEEKKEKGFFTKIWDALTEEIPEEEETENKDQKEKKEKKKNAKKKGKKAQLDADDNEGILEELDAEEDTGKKGKKAKKSKETKKQKKQPKPKGEASLMDLAQDSKKLPMKMVLRIFALCCSVMVLVLLVNQFVPKFWSLTDARNAFYKRDYETTYKEMSGKKLSESDQRLYEKAKMILQLNHKLDAYGNYEKMNMPVEALDSLLSGYLLWQKLGDKITKYDAVSETEEIKIQIVEILSSEYQISEQAAEEINALSDYDYTMKLEEITGSFSRQNSIFDSKQDEEAETPLADEDTQQTEQQSQIPTENVLPEEEVQ